jgi:hypothetical protein
MTFPTELSFGGNWTITVASKDSTNEQRFVTTGSANDATVAGNVGTTLNVVAVPGVNWTLKIQNRVGTGAWNPSAVLMGPITYATGTASRVLYGEDSTSGGSFDFNDVVLNVSRQLPLPLFLEAKDVFEVPQFASGIEIRTQLRDENGRAISLAAFEPGELTVSFALAWVEGPTVLLIRADGATIPGEPPRPAPGVGRVVDAQRGIVAYTVQADDFQRTGRYEGEFWIAQNGPPGTPPFESFAYPVKRKLDIRVFKTVGGNLFPPP